MVFSVRVSIGQLILVISLLVGCAKLGPSKTPEITAREKEPPDVEVSLHADPEKGKAPLTVRLRGEVAGAKEEDVTYEWDFDDGEERKGKPREVHTYQRGSYFPKVTVYDKEGRELDWDFVIITAE